MRNWKTDPPKNHEEAVDMVLEKVTKGAELAVAIYGGQPPEITREDRHGQTIVTVTWDSGDQNEFTISSGRIQ